MEWVKISEHGYPEDGERVLVWDEYFKQACILCYNAYYKCWDDEEGDDRYDSLNENIYPAWMRIEKFK